MHSKFQNHRCTPTQNLKINVYLALNEQKHNELGPALDMIQTWPGPIAYLRCEM